MGPKDGVIYFPKLKVGVLSLSSLDFTILNIHGHTHISENQDTVHGVPILNPNPLFDGKYAEIYLEKDSESSLWKVADIKTNNL